MLSCAAVKLPTSWCRDSAVACSSATWKALPNLTQRLVGASAPDMSSMLSYVKSLHKLVHLIFTSYIRHSLPVMGDKALQTKHLPQPSAAQLCTVLRELCFCQEPPINTTTVLIRSGKHTTLHTCTQLCDAVWFACQVESWSLTSLCSRPACCANDNAQTYQILSDHSWLRSSTPELQVQVTGPVLLLSFCHASVLVMWGWRTQRDVQARFAGHCNAGCSDVDCVMAATDRAIRLCDVQKIMPSSFCPYPVQCQLETCQH